MRENRFISSFGVGYKFRISSQVSVPAISFDAKTTSPRLALTGATYRAPARVTFSLTSSGAHSQVMCLLELSTHFGGGEHSPACLGQHLGRMRSAACWRPPEFQR